MSHREPRPGVLSREVTTGAGEEPEPQQVQNQGTSGYDQHDLPLAVQRRSSIAIARPR
jgi:hypothetical protein